MCSLTRMWREVARCSTGDYRLREDSRRPRARCMRGSAARCVGAACVRDARATAAAAAGGMGRGHMGALAASQRLQQRAACSSGYPLRGYPPCTPGTRGPRAGPIYEGTPHYTRPLPRSKAPSRTKKGSEGTLGATVVLKIKKMDTR